MNDDDATPEERREAEALARALAGEPGLAPADALATAALLDFARTDGRLAPDRRTALLQRARPRVRRRVWLLVPLAAAAVIAIVWVPRAPVWPRPTAELLRAQAAAARGEGLDRLDLGMRVYRRAMFARLGVTPGGAP